MAYTTIDDSEAYFQVKLYTGVASSQGDGTNTAHTLDGDTDMQPDLIWIKNRDGTDWHDLTDSVRGATKSIFTNVNDIEDTSATSLISFNSDGFNVGSSDQVNDASDKYVAWCWKESVTAGFDIIAYTGTGSVMNVSHNLSAVPDFFAIKNLEVDQAWRVYHQDMTIADPYSARMVFSEDGAPSTSALGLDADPTSSVININDDTGTTNASDEDMIVYAWAEKQGFSKFGSYSGNGNADGSFIYTGFRPAFVMIKRDNAAGRWNIMDNKRLGYNAFNPRLYPDEAEAEDDTETPLDILSNGFKLRATSQYINHASGTYVYAAFAEAPFVNSNGVPCNAR